MAILVAVALSLVSQQADVARLIERLSADDLAERERAAVDLRAAGEGAIAPLESAMPSADPALRLVIRRLLHDLSATSALIEDLKSDDVEGNARTARAKLRERWSPAIKSALLAALKSADDQQAIQAAYLLAALGEKSDVLAEAPEVLERVARIVAEGRDAKFRWVAAEAVVRLGAASGAAAREASWTRALRDVHPSKLRDPFLAIHQVSARHHVPMPDALIRHFLRNLANDDVEANAQSCRHEIRKIGPSLAPDVRRLLTGSDLQARSMATALLLEWKQDVPVEDLAVSITWSTEAKHRLLSLGPAAIPALKLALSEPDGRLVREAAGLIIELEPGKHDGELAIALARFLVATRKRWWDRDDTARKLRALGPAAEKALEERSRDSTGVPALGAATALLAIDGKRHLPTALERAIRELADDGDRRNARVASQLLLDLGPDAVPRLRELLVSDRDQAIVCAAAVLAREGLLEEIPARTLEAISRYADAFESNDEPGSLLELLAWSPPARAVVMKRLEAASRSRAESLRILLTEHDNDSWLVPGSAFKR